MLMYRMCRFKFTTTSKYLTHILPNGKCCSWIFYYICFGCIVGVGRLLLGLLTFGHGVYCPYHGGLFGGLNTCRKQNGFIVKFRPEEDASRMVQGAERMCMPSPTVGRFLEIVKLMMVKNKHWFRQ